MKHENHPAPPSFDVFISHASQDKKVADSVCAILEQQRLRCWIAPRDILPGKEWAHAILEGIENSRSMVVILSNFSNNSAYVQREIERAVKNGLVVVPVRIENVIPSKSLELYLSVTHWLDAIPPEAQDHFMTLARNIKTILGIDQAQVVEAATPAPKRAESNEVAIQGLPGLAEIAPVKPVSSATKTVPAAPVPAPVQSPGRKTDPNAFLKSLLILALIAALVTWSQWQKDRKEKEKQEQIENFRKATESIDRSPWLKGLDEK